MQSKLLGLSLMHGICFAPPHPAEGPYGGVCGVLPKDLGPGHVARKIVVKLTCNGLHLR